MRDDPVGHSPHERSASGEGPASPDGHGKTTPVELEATALLARRSGPDEPVLRAIEREIEMIIEHLAELRSIRVDLETDLARSECRVKTDLLRAAARPYVIDTANPNHPFNEPPRMALKRRLEDLARERRTVSMDLRARRTALLDRLAALVERHRQVRGAVHGL
jgi:hypothetical protein